HQMWTLGQNSMCGIQTSAKDFAQVDAGSVFDRIMAVLPLNAASVFAGKNLRRSPGHAGGSLFRQPALDLDEHGRDVLDRMLAAAEPRGIRVILGIGEAVWGYQEHYPGYSTIAMVDHAGRTHRQSCVNNPGWRNFQLASYEATFRDHPDVRSAMFMHERTGPLSSMLTGQNPWGDHYKGFCFCEHCCRKGVERGIDPQRAREGYRQLARLGDAARSDQEAPPDGWLVSIWRLFMRYPEIFAWEQLWWDSLHDYRAAVVGAIKMAQPEADVGFHFQHATHLGQFIWRAGDDPERIIEYADWVKPSVYPGCSGGRFRKSMHGMSDFLFKDMPRSLAKDVMAWICGHDPASLPDLGASEGQVAFGADWVQRETARVRSACAPRPLFAGMGIGIPGGDEAEDVDLIRSCTEACFDGGADGILLSRHFDEMRPEFLEVAGEVIRRRLSL
ncbi:MAG: hypothetical protein ACOCXA_09765, partial [Planctomycetota bacterium]